MALLLNGTSTYLRTAYTTALAAPADAVTVSAWIKPSATTGEIVGRHLSASTTNSVFVLDLANGAIRMGVGSRSMLGTYSTLRASGGSVTTGRWYHVAGTCDGTTVRVFLNGIQVGSVGVSGTLQTSATPLVVGAHYNGTSASNFFKGEIADLRNYARVLTANEILTMYTVDGRDGIIGNIIVLYPLSGAISQSLSVNYPILDIGPNNISSSNIIAGSIVTADFGSIRSSN